MATPMVRVSLPVTERHGTCQHCDVKTTWGSIHKKAPPEFTRPFPPIFRVLFGFGLPGGTGDARSGIFKVDGSDPPF